MKNKSKILMLATMIGGAAVALTACPTPPSTTKVIFWHTMGKSSIEILDGVIAQFEKENPGIKVTHAAKGGYNELRTAVENAIAAGDVPTMAYCYPDHVANYLTSNAVVRIDETFLKDPELAFTAEEGLESDFIEAYWQEGQCYDVEGMYSVPFSKSTEVMFYNKTAFQANGWEVPTTWAEMETLMAKIKAKDPSKTPLGYDSDSNLFITLCEQYGIPYTTNENITKGADHFLFNNTKAKEMVTRVKGWYTNGWFTSQGTSEDGGYTSTKFKNGELYMTVGSTGGTTYNYSDNFEIGIAPIPGAETDGGNSHVIMQGPSITFLRRCTPEQKAASWKFYKYLVNAENSANFATKTGYSPARTSSFECDTWNDFMNDTTITGAEDLVRRTVDFNKTLMNKYFTSATFKGSSTARDEVGGIITTVCTGAKTLDEAFTDAYNNCVYAA